MVTIAMTACRQREGGVAAELQLNHAIQLMPTVSTAEHASGIRAMFERVEHDEVIAF